MRSFFLLENVIRDYPWGHQNHIQELLGVPNPDGRPAAELWMGAHPSAPSRIVIGDDVGEGRIGLDEWILSRPDDTLGTDLARRYGRLPFLFKLLAAGSPLSIQAHPSKEQAEEGFRREDRMGIPRDAPGRNYRDDNHKPEILMALTPFTAMAGFRAPAEIKANFSFLAENGSDAPGFLSQIQERHSDSLWLRHFLEKLLTMGPEMRSDLIEKAVNAAGKKSVSWSELTKNWVRRLATRYPGDSGVLAPLFLNVLRLQPDEAVYLGAGELHAYLEGFGVELMANSDNVLRGGLTSKHIDVPELLKVLNFKAVSPEILKPADASPDSFRFFETPAPEFSLGIADVEPGQSVYLEPETGPFILLSLEGEGVLDDGQGHLRLPRGMSAFIPRNARRITVSGRCRAVLAGTGR